MYRSNSEADNVLERGCHHRVPRTRLDRYLKRRAFIGEPENPHRLQSRAPWIKPKVPSPTRQHQGAVTDIFPMAVSTHEATTPLSLGHIKAAFDRFTDIAGWPGLGGNLCSSVPDTPVLGCTCAVAPYPGRCSCPRLYFVKCLGRLAKRDLLRHWGPDVHHLFAIIRVKVSRATADTWRRCPGPFDVGPGSADRKHAMNGVTFCTWQQEQLLELGGIGDAACEGENLEVPAADLGDGGLLGTYAGCTGS